ncbi:hypothetical protein [Bacillus safensis]|uniref:hypothetical protein n=1 Tax=Bacillus safensis TaxID=561879 RepID=UPI00115DEA5D|nr:hypothetical protein [Bacillus sp. SDF0016]TQR24703.1 hypothetical protein C7Y46_09615 [Bacillus sp. SDF0016]
MDLIAIPQLISTLVSIFVLILAILTLKENLKTRKLSINPLLYLSKILEFTSDHTLLAANFTFPITGDVKHFTTLRFGLKNIGKGPAKNVRIISFASKKETETESFKVSSNVISIPEGDSIPFLIRTSYEDTLDFDFTTYTTTIYYENILGNGLYFSARLCVQQGEVIVLEYTDKDTTEWQEIISSVPRALESYGYFEMKKTEDNMLNDHSFKN